MYFEIQSEAVNCLLFQKPHVLRQLGRLDKTSAVIIDNVRCDNLSWMTLVMIF